MLLFKHYAHPILLSAGTHWRECEAATAGSYNATAAVTTAGIGTAQLGPAPCFSSTFATTAARIAAAFFSG
jgi:hypothetical protein